MIPASKAVLQEVVATAGYEVATVDVSEFEKADGGLTWSAPRLMEPMAPGWLQSDPWLALDESGTLFFARLEVSLEPEQAFSRNGINRRNT